MIGSRTRHSLAQFLELHEIDFVVVLVSKHGIHISVENGSVLSDINNCLRSASEEHLLSLVEEIARTSGDLRSRVNPKYRHDERFSDLCRCLQLDGYLLEGKTLTQIDPSIGDAPPLDDDLLQELRTSGLTVAEEIALKINASSESFRSSPPNYNACLNDVRVALETLARAIAATQEKADSPPYEKTKWGSVLTFLKSVGFYPDFTDTSKKPDNGRIKECLCRREESTVPSSSEEPLNKSGNLGSAAPKLPENWESAPMC